MELREDWLPPDYQPDQGELGPIRENGRPYPGWCNLGDHEAERTWVKASTLPIIHACRSCIRTRCFDAWHAAGDAPPAAFFEI